MAEQELDDIIKKLKAQKLANQNKLLERKLRQTITKEEHEQALENTKIELLAKISNGLKDLPNIFIMQKIISDKQKQQVENAIAIWLENIAE